MSDAKHSENQPSFGVEALIQRLRDEGVQAGQEQADEMLRSAQQRAEMLLEDAQREAELIIKQARDQRQREESAGREALHIAMRDTVLEMKSHLSYRFGEEVKRLVAYELKQEKFLERLILAVADRVRAQANLDDADQIEVLLPPDIAGLDELRRHPESLREGSLSHFVLTVANQLLRDGVTFRDGKAGQAGIQILMKDGELQVDLSPETVTEVIMEHLNPRFRAILEGTVK